MKNYIGALFAAIVLLTSSCNCKNDKKVLFVVTSHNELGATEESTGYWLSEVTHPWHILVEAGYTIDFVSPQGGKAPIDKRSYDTKDSINNLFLNSELYQSKIANTLSPNQIDASNYDAIFYAGGHGTMWDFPNNQSLNQIAAKVYDDGGIVGAVCHGPAGIVNVKLRDGNYLVNGKKVSAFTNEEEAKLELNTIVPFSLEDELVKQGAIIKKAGMWEAKVSIDERLVTGQNPQSAAAVGNAMLELLKQD
ncbi:MAG: type 1 glutamine amidotransferase domain-containing protein [Carboxylicivirga sp.]|jgi:putative intracellular protease/amidase|nr:type 1 glutamine amidotransferase domain-containing protein [Carboxylicivirga sp.]